MKPIRILLVDDHQMIRTGILSYLKSDTRYEIAGEASNGREALEFLGSEKVDLVIMDINMEEMDGISCTKEVVKLYPGTKVLALSMLSESTHIRAMMNAGASGYLLKNSKESELKKAIDTIADGGTFFSEDVTAVIMNNLAKRNAKAPKKSRFSPDIPISAREKEVLELVVKEMTNQQIAEKLFISVRTVDAHKRNLIEKTGVKNVAGLVLYAVNRQLFEDV